MRMWLTLPTSLHTKRQNQMSVTQTDFPQTGNVVAWLYEAKINLHESVCFDHILCLKDGQSLCS